MSFRNFSSLSVSFKPFIDCIVVLTVCRDERGLSAELSKALLTYMSQSEDSTFHLQLLYIGSVNTVLKGGFLLILKGTVRFNSESFCDLLPEITFYRGKILIKIGVCKT
jgi:hypothetical protein